MHIVGLDIGFSERKRTNALAIVRDGVLTVPELMYPSERDAALRLLDAVDVIAIDAPIVPAGTPEHLSRKCEHIFSCGDFQRRCKPGMSHVRGTGRQLRAEGRRAADQITGSATRIVEAFPNTFLGVILPEEAFPSPPGRSRKFNWLYEQWIERELFRQIVAAAQLPPEVTVRCEREPNRDVRAALICLITAAFVADDNYAAIGDETAGHFYLPPMKLWQMWALRSLPVHLSETSPC